MEKVAPLRGAEVGFDFFKLALDVVEAIIGRLSLRRAFGQHAVELLDQIVVFRRQSIDARLLLVGERPGGGMELVK